ncbi:EsV-1-71 [Ectocarpus siliculosus]|uniref:EsV-1-71 n=1 Tax=Ectocarpus siliculosus TaxID=2880 RepID=D8LPA3_ECTSI|nr:EsV-1-71 [Ectocarpus siliculosus]|eukprot:CBN80374.1 EsV-1-71 [Ectocarpus siliculosus]
MSSAYATDLSQYPISISGDQIVQNIIQVAQSDGIDAVSLDHDFYGISQSGRVFSLASFRVVESGPNTNTGTLELHIFNSDGVSVPILTIGEDGTTIEGSLNVKGGHTSLETTSVVVEDKDMVLASGATSVDHLDKGGIILGTDESGAKEMLYDLGGDMWKSNIGINVDTDAAFTVGDAQTILDGAGLTIGDVSLTDGSLQLAPDISLGTEGLEIGDISVTPLGGLVIGSSDGSDVDTTVVLNKTGLTIGEEINLGVDSGLSIGSDVLLDEQGLYLKNTEAALYLGQTGWKIAYDSSSHHLLFEFYDANSSSYVTKAEFKA